MRKAHKTVNCVRSLEFIEIALVCVAFAAAKAAVAAAAFDDVNDDDDGSVVVFAGVLVYVSVSVYARICLCAYVLHIMRDN